MPAVLVKGQNAPLAAASIVVTVDVAAPADLSALLVTANGKVRSDADFLFFNQPDGPGVSCRAPEAGLPWRIEMRLAEVPAEIAQVRVVVSLETEGARFGGFPPPVAKVVDPTGAPLVEYQVVGLATESIVIALEVYRRGSDWKVRAVGQGYAGGLADLITDHGVSVDDPGTSAPSAPPPSVAAPAPVRAPAPAASSYPAPMTPPSTPPPATPPPAPPAAPSLPAGEVSLVKGRSVSLLKGQRVSLRKDDGGSLTVVRMGLGWDPVKKKGMFGGGRGGDIDLDASALLYSQRQPVDVVYFGNLRSKDGSIQHLGDNLTGAGEGDDESIIVDLQKVPAQVDAIVFLVSSYRGQTFEQVANAFCRLLDQNTNGELARYTLTGGGPHTGMVMAKVFRESGSWKLQAIGEGIAARTAKDAIPQLDRFL